MIIIIIKIIKRLLCESLPLQSRMSHFYDLSLAPIFNIVHVLIQSFVSDAPGEPRRNTIKSFDAPSIIFSPGYVSELKASKISLLLD